MASSLRSSLSAYWCRSRALLEGLSRRIPWRHSAGPTSWSDPRLQPRPCYERRPGSEHSWPSSRSRWPCPAPTAPLRSGGRGQALVNDSPPRCWTASWSRVGCLLCILDHRYCSRTEPMHERQCEVEGRLGLFLRHRCRSRRVTMAVMLAGVKKL